uniref:Uncharacterized protein n=1 Tax=Tanacetum cinerariifolium TaxID=118510 RepID=A0A6L2NX67_TANCI|nr:hypothetical protein [Tanacetum cinerariifolium]
MHNARSLMNLPDYVIRLKWSDDLAYGKIGKAVDQTFGLRKVNSVPSGLVSISPVPDPSTHDDPSVNSVYGSCGVSITNASGGASSGFSTRKSARIWLFINVRGRLAPGLAFPLGYSLARKLAGLGSQNRPLFESLFRIWRWKSLFLMHLFKVLKSGKDFFADLEMNLFRLASFSLRLWTSLIVRGDGSYNTAFVLSGHSFIPFGLIMYHRNIPFAAPTVHFLGLSFMLICRNVWNVSSISRSSSVSV